MSVVKYYVALKELPVRVQGLSAEAIQAQLRAAWPQVELLADWEGASIGFDHRIVSLYRSADEAHGRGAPYAHFHAAGLKDGGLAVYRLDSSPA